MKRSAHQDSSSSAEKKHKAPDTEELSRKVVISPSGKWKQVVSDLERQLDCVFMAIETPSDLQEECGDEEDSVEVEGRVKQRFFDKVDFDSMAPEEVTREFALKRVKHLLIPRSIYHGECLNVDIHHQIAEIFIENHRQKKPGAEARITQLVWDSVLLPLIQEAGKEGKPVVTLLTILVGLCRALLVDFKWLLNHQLFQDNQTGNVISQSFAKYWTACEEAGASSLGLTIAGGKEGGYLAELKQVLIEPGLKALKRMEGMA